MENKNYNKEIIESMINFYNDPFKGLSFTKSGFIDCLKCEKIPELLKSKYGYEKIKAINPIFYIDSSRDLVNSEYKDVCDETGVDIEEILKEYNIPTEVHKVSLSCYFIASKDEKCFLSKLELNGSLEFGLKDNITFIQEIDRYDFSSSWLSSSLKLRLIHNNEITTYSFEENYLLDIYKKEIKGNFVTMNPCLLSYLNNSIYLEGERVYTDKKRIANVDMLDTNKNRVSDFVDTMDSTVLLITFEDDTCRLLLMNDDKKSTTKYFKKLEYEKAYIEKYDEEAGPDDYPYPYTGLTFNYETDTEYGELLVEDNPSNKQYKFSKISYGKK